MYAEGDSAWGTAFAHHPSTIQLRLYATELTEQLRLVDPYENELGAFNESSAAVGVASQKLIDELDFPTSDYTHAGFIQATILQAQDLDLLGLPDAESPLSSIETYCCTPFYVDQGMCVEDDLGAIIIDRNVSAFDIWTYDLPLLPRRSGSEPTKWVERQSAHRLDRAEAQRATYNVRSTGEHVLILSHCDPTLNTEVAVSGLTEWRNPFGYLPGRLFGFLNFHKYMLVFYVLFGAVWLGLNIRHWKELTSLQFSTSVVIFLCMAEQLTWYSEYSHFNNVGTRHLGVISFAIALSVLRQTVSRMLIMAVALGFQIIKPSLGENKVRLIVLSVSYFVLECALELIVRYQQTHPLNDYYRILLTLPVSVLNAAFYWWIFISLYQLMQHLEERKQDLKFALYRSFTNTLLYSAGAALLFALYQSYFMLTNQYAWHWSYLWIIDGGFSFGQRDSTTSTACGVQTRVSPAPIHLLWRNLFALDAHSFSCLYVHFAQVYTPLFWYRSPFCFVRATWRAATPTRPWAPWTRRTRTSPRSRWPQGETRMDRLHPSRPAARRRSTTMRTTRTMCADSRRSRRRRTISKQDTPEQTATRVCSSVTCRVSKEEV